jgi:hypothetical protein
MQDKLPPIKLVSNNLMKKAVREEKNQRVLLNLKARSKINKRKLIWKNYLLRVFLLRWFPI